MWKLLPYWDKCPVWLKPIIAPFLLLGLLVIIFASVLLIPYQMVDEMFHPEKYDSPFD